MKAKDLMTKEVLSVGKDARIDDVLDTMTKHNVSKLLVLDKGHVVGVLADGDIADELGAIKNRGVPGTQLHASTAMRRKFSSVGPDADLRVLLEAFLTQQADILPVMIDEIAVGVITASDLLSLVTTDRPLADVMTNRLQVTSPSDRVIHARRMMLDEHVGHLPVLDKGALVGIVGEIDIARGLARFKRSVADSHQPAALQRFLVQEIMQQTVITGAPDMGTQDAVALMRKRDVGSLPVMRSERLVGIVTRSDLLREIAV